MFFLFKKRHQERTLSCPKGVALYNCKQSHSTVVGPNDSGLGAVMNTPKTANVSFEVVVPGDLVLDSGDVSWPATLASGEIMSRYGFGIACF